jgi:predicted O-methyltransferase YrrM
MAEALEIPGETPPQDIEKLIEIVDSLPDNAVIVELGTCIGSSGIAMAKACRGTKRKVFLVDNFDDEAHIDRGGWVLPSRKLLEKNLVDHRVKSRCAILEGDSAQIGKDWSGPPVDFLFVDADHTYDGVTADLEAWYPHMKERGIIALHDYNNDFVEVKRAAFVFFGRGADVIHWLTGIYYL